MNKKTSQAHATDQEIERLLRETLRDDPPAGLEKRLDARWAAFHDKAMSEAVRGRRLTEGRRRLSLHSILPKTGQFLPKGALAAAAVGMIVWGALMQAGGSSNVLAKNLNLIKTTVLVKDWVSRAPSLLCRVEVTEDLDRGREYLVQWLPPNLQRVDVRDREGGLIRTVWVRNQDITVAERGEEDTYSIESIGQIDDPYLPVILNLIRPQELAARLYGEWQETGRVLREDCVWSTFRISSLEEGREAFEMTVDLCDYRPEEIRRDLGTAEAPQAGGRATLHIRFDWDQAIPAERMIPEKTTAPRDV